MPPRRTQQFTDYLGPDTVLRAQWETERDVVRYAVVLITEVDAVWRPVVLFDCSHDDRNDRHDYTSGGIKRPAVIFHHGTPGEGMRDALALIREGFQRMIEEWQR